MDRRQHHAGEDNRLAAHRRLLERFSAGPAAPGARHPERFISVYELACKEALPRCAISTGEDGWRRRTRRHHGQLLFLYALATWPSSIGSLVLNGGFQPAGACGVGEAGAQWPASVSTFSRNLRAAARVPTLREVQDADPSWLTMLSVSSGAIRLPRSRCGERQAGRLKANQGALRRLLTGLARLLG